eukprot:CAMPEP_0206171364 /NCGR_PEP_ID=MMETSP1474-20131121/42054_1 /ASSEMBLY_ACC=CAM_ASM_001110 /TAXON_ID=97495 /ORGANISM="Imantonia sp., Strain RCC918" /LENGTH=89 /DNA_ID=CAMNT_0053578743 /DNA_START=31 /DNA_END=298 /DNA_ORIENTATION=-
MSGAGLLPSWCTAVLALAKLPPLAAEVRVGESDGPHPDESERQVASQRRRVDGARMCAVEVGEERRQDGPVRIDEPERPLRQAHQPEAH